MSISRTETAYHTPRKPTPIRAIAALLIAPNGVARRMLTTVRDQVEDVSACMSESRPLDLSRDAYARSEARLAHLGVKRALIKGCGCERGFMAILADNAAMQLLDARVDTLVWGEAWTTARRLAGCLGRVLLARKGGAR